MTAQLYILYKLKTDLSQSKSHYFLTLTFASVRSHLTLILKNWKTLSMYLWALQGTHTKNRWGCTDTYFYTCCTHTEFKL